MASGKVVPIAERRRVLRQEIEIPVEIETKGGRIPARTKNISVLGGYIVTDAMILPGESVTIHFRVHPPIAVSAKVIWLDQGGEKVFGIGVGFNILKEEEQKTLEDLLSRLSSS
jgi:hypothetical protein